MPARALITLRALRDEWEGRRRVALSSYKLALQPPTRDLYFAFEVACSDQAIARAAKALAQAEDRCDALDAAIAALERTPQP